MRKREAQMREDADTLPPLVLAWFQEVSARHELLPFLLALWLAGDLLELEQREMRIAFILHGLPMSEI